MNIERLNQYKSDGLILNQFHPTLPLIIWNYSAKCQYDQVWDDLTLQCRGLVTDLDGQIISRGFSKFFNLGESKHISTDDFELFDKLDGQYIGVFWYNGEMVINSRGSFDSIYSREAKRILDEKYPDFEKQATGYGRTYCFELIGFEQIVVSYSEADLTATGCFNLDGNEVRLTHRIRLFGVPIAERFDGLDYKNVKELNWKNKEGFVVRFSNGDRCKVKFDDYVKLHRQMTNLSTTGIWAAMMTGVPVSTILSEVPDEFYDKVHQIENNLNTKFNEIDSLTKVYFEYFKPLLQHSRKLFAAKVNSLLINPYKANVLAMVDGYDYSESIWKTIEPKFKKI